MVKIVKEDVSALGVVFDQDEYVEFVTQHEGYREFAYVKVHKHVYDFYDGTRHIPKLLGKGYLIMAIAYAQYLSVALGKMKVFGMMDHDGYAWVLEGVSEHTLEEYEQWGKMVVESIDAKYEPRVVTEEMTDELDKLLDEYLWRPRVSIEDIERACHLIVQYKRWDALIVLVETGILVCPESYEYVISFVQYLKTVGIIMPPRVEYRLNRVFYYVRNFLERGNRVVKHPLFNRSGH